MNSMKYDVGVGGFVGARTEIVPPTLNNPPGVTACLFDLTHYRRLYTDTFANMGVTVFGHAMNPGGPGTFGNQVQFADEYAMAGKAAGTYLNQLIIWICQLVRTGLASRSIRSSAQSIQMT